MAKRVLVIEDDTVVRVFIRHALEQEGYEVREMESAAHLMSVVHRFAPALVVCDMLMPGQDGLSVCRALHADPHARSIPVILVSDKDYEQDKRAAMRAGAAGYLLKPIKQEDLMQAVSAALSVEVSVKIWGCRGSAPAPEHAQGLYGGNTSCITITLPWRRQIIFDAGTGIRSLGNSVMIKPPMQFHICLTHYHWDHIQGLPFFKPLYAPSNEVIIYGPAENNEAIAEKMAGQMGRDYFPVSMDSLMSSVKYVALGEQTFEIHGAKISTLYTLHPGRTLAFRVEVAGHSIVYAPDNELLPESVESELSGEALRIAQFASSATLLLHDCAYSREIYQRRRGWGHSYGSAVAAVSAHAGVKRVLLFHHDPDNSDEDVRAIHQEFQRALPNVDVPSEPAREGVTYPL